MPPGLQAKLLRVLQEKEVRPIGGRDAEPVEARIIAATNRDLRGEVARGAFREDLYYRLNVVEIAVPALRDRREDIPALVDHFLGRLRQDVDFPARRVSADAIRALMRHPWPGNVRELENCVKSAALLTLGPVIDVKDLRIDPYLASREGPVRRPHVRWGEGDIQNRHDWEAHERTRIIEALVRAGWNKTRAASDLGISRRNLYRKLARYGIEGSQ
jgi:DNA-binding NtrC family response regulator